MTYAWFEAGAGRQVYRRVREPKTGMSRFPSPMLVRDFSEPVQSMANGRWYTSKAGLAASYRPSGNPQGEEFVEIGNEKLTVSSPEPDAAQRRQDIRQAMHDVVTGNLPPEIAAVE